MSNFGSRAEHAPDYIIIEGRGFGFRTSVSDQAQNIGKSAAGICVSISLPLEGRGSSVKTSAEGRSADRADR